MLKKLSLLTALIMGYQATECANDARINGILDAIRLGRQAMAISLYADALASGDKDTADSVAAKASVIKFQYGRKFAGSNWDTDVAPAVTFYRDLQAADTDQKKRKLLGELFAGQQPGAKAATKLGVGDAANAFAKAVAP